MRKDQQVLADAVPALITIYNIKTGRYIFVNQGLKQVLGYQPSDFLEKGLQFVFGLVHPEDLVRIQQENEAAITVANQQGKRSPNDQIITFVYRIRHADGGWRWLRTDGRVYARDEQGNVEKLLNVSIDITPRKENEDRLRQMTTELERRVQERTRQLQESDERYRSFLSQSSEAIWRFEVEEPILVKLPIKKQLELIFKHAYLAECNDALARLYGFQHAQDIVGSRLSDFLPQNPHNIAYIKSFIESGYRLTDAESQEYDKDGNERFFLNNLVGIVENDHLLRAWGIQRDITDFKKLQQQKDDFIALASHELKTPLTSLKMLTQILHHTVVRSGDVKLAEQLHGMDKQINRMTRLINRLLDVSRLDKGKLTYHDTIFALSPLIREVSTNLQRTTSTHRTIFTSRSRLRVRADRERISQVLTNVISNAIKYSPKAKQVIIKLKKQAETVLVSVEDFGIGVAEKERTKIFERFFQAKNPTKQAIQGLGLGLYISKEIVSHYDGSIWVESKQGKGERGAVFYFTLPLVEEKSPVEFSV